MLTDRRTFILYTAYYKPVEGLPDEDAGKVFKAILHYVAAGEIRDLGDATLNAILGIIIDRLENDLQRYEERCRGYRDYD